MSSLGRCVLIGHLHRNVLDKALSKQHNTVQSDVLSHSEQSVVGETSGFESDDSIEILMGELCPLLSSTIAQSCSVSAPSFYINLKTYYHTYIRVCSSFVKGTLFFNIPIYEL